MVAVAHPDLLALALEPAAQKRRARAFGGNKGPAKFGGAVAAFNPAAQAMHHHLLAIANAQNRHAKRKHAGRRHRRAIGKNRAWATRQNNRKRRKIGQKRIINPVERMNFAIDIQLAQAARNKLRNLAAKVDDKQFLV